MLGGQVSEPIFGLGVEKTVSLINELLDYGLPAVGVGLCERVAPADHAC
jgi:hypothetical protein